MRELLGTEALLAAIYSSGLTPDMLANSWRMPSSQMLLEVARDLNIDLPSSLLIGDRLSDLKAVMAAGVAPHFHVLGGHGRNACAIVPKWLEQRWEAGETDSVSFLQLLDSLEVFPTPLMKRDIPAR